MTRTRRALALTPLIDVIFLLLLFFMLTTSFVREVDLPLAPAEAGLAGGERPAFLDLGPDSLTLNGAAVDPVNLAARLADEAALLIRLQPGVTAQRLVDVLAPLSRLPDLRVRVLG